MENPVNRLSVIIVVLSGFLTRIQPYLVYIMKKKKILKEIRKARKEIRLAVVEILGNDPKKEWNYKQISAALNIHDDITRKVVMEVLIELAEEQIIKETQAGKFRGTARKSYLRGIIDMLSSGNAFLVSPDSEEDIYIQSRFINGAFHGDEVEVHLLAARKGKRLEGEVVSILHRARTQFVGRLEMSEGFAFLLPDNEKMHSDIFIPKGELNQAQDGEKVIVEIIEWPEKGKNPVGKVVRVLGMPGKHETEMHAILAEYGLSPEFPEAVEKEAKSIPVEITAAEIAKRLDFRDITTLTIDPVDAKDFDDALSLRQLENGNWEVGVHIADVTHYVREKTKLEKEAAKRATSVYLVDRVVPMLPENLSNGVCSLRPNEDKLCFSAVFEMTDEARLLNEWFGRTVIHSDRRFTYEEAQQVIETGKGDFAGEILTLHKLAQVLRKERFDNGALRVEQQEVKFRLDANGKPIEVYHKVSKEANWLIEEFMLMANKKVAEFVGKKDKAGKAVKTFVYRVHDTPDLEKLKEFKRFVSNFGYKLDLNNPKTISSSLNQLLKDVKDKPEANMIESLAIRSMAKAIYTTENVGHYGLGFDFYSHFTSPIRRYPDMMAHRLLQHYLDGGASVPAKELEAQCKHSSDMEKRAAEAERASIKYKQVEFMKDHVGKVFDGVISGVTEWGIYVELDDNKCEGMIRLRDIDDDFYHFDEKNYRVVGSKYKRVYRLGDKVKVEVKRADLEKRQIDFRIWDED